MMDTSTPLKQSRISQSVSCLVEKYSTECSTRTKHETSLVFSNELPDCSPQCSDSKYADSPCSMEVFPVSPIRCAKNAQFGVACLPYLDSSNLKWSSSFHTSYAEDETVETGIMDEICSQSQYYNTVNRAETSFELNETSDDNVEGEGMAAMKDISNVLRSPVFAAGKCKRRLKKSEKLQNESVAQRVCDSTNEAEKYLPVTPNLTGEKDRAEASPHYRHLDEYVFELDDSYYGNATSKVRCCSLDRVRENSKKFVYPLSDFAIKKPQSCLPVDRLTNQVLSLETSDDSRRWGTKPRGSSQNATEPKALLAFNEIYCNANAIRGSTFVHAETSLHKCSPAVAVKHKITGDGTYPSAVRAFVEIMFARKNNNRRTIEARFDVISDRLADRGPDSGSSFLTRLTRSLYSTYYFVTYVRLADCKTDQIYKHNAVLDLTSRLSSIFKMTVSFVYAQNIFDRFGNDAYALESMGIPVVALYANHCNAFHRLSGEFDFKTDERDAGFAKNCSTSNAQRERRVECVTNEMNANTKTNFTRTLSENDWIAGTTSVLKTERVRDNNYGNAADGDQYNYSVAYAGFRTANGNRLLVPETSFKRIINRYSDIINGERDNDVLKVDIKRRRIESEASHVAGSCERVKTSPSCQQSRNVFGTSVGKTVDVRVDSPPTSNHLFSDIIGKAGPDDGLCDGRENTFARTSRTDKTLATGFKTCSGRTVDIQDRAWLVSKNLFADISYDTDFDIADRGDAAPRTSSFVTGFGEPIKVGHQSLRASNDLFSDALLPLKCGPESAGSERSSESKKANETTTPRFETDSSGTINVEAEWLRASDALFSDVLNEMRANDAALVGSRPGFRTGVGKTVNVDARSLEKSMNLFADVYALPGSEFRSVDAAVRSNTEKCENEVEANSRRCSPPGVQNQSFDWSREITESTSAFLYDISNEQSRSSFFVPDESSASANESARSLADNAGKCGHSSVQNRSGSSSPVFDAKYAPSKRKCSTRKSVTAQALNVTYVRKATADGSSGRGDRPVQSGDQICAELETLKMNFSFKSAKRKSNYTDSVPATIKKSKNSNHSLATTSADHDERREPSPGRAKTDAIARQRRYIRNKPKEHCLPTRGYYSTVIGNSGNAEDAGGAGRVSLGFLARYEKPKRYSVDECYKLGLPPAVVRINSQNARHFAFTREFITDEQAKRGTDSAILFGDAVPVIFNERNEITVEEVIAGFLASPGVDPKLISRQWIANHYRWIVWKLASTERFFPNLMGRRYLTPDNVLFQLKYKYEREIDRCVRSALKRILEGDDSPARPLVLCIASIEKTEHSLNRVRIELTDGWYSILAEADDHINDLIARKRLVVGSKLITIGAELVGWREPCDPLQANENVRLKFSANSSRRARWDTRLGFYNGKLGPTNSIQTILPKGGFISHLTAVVARVYPLLFLERHENVLTAADVAPATGNAKTCTPAVTWSRLHNEKVEIKKSTAYERDRQSFIESILSQVTNQVLSETAETDAGSIAHFVQRPDDERLRDTIQQRVQSRLPVKFSKNRNVSRLLKLRLVDAQDAKNKASAILTIWNPCEDVACFFKEHRSYGFFNVNANNIRSGELQLVSTRSSKYDGGCSSGGSDDHWFGRRVRTVDDFIERGRSAEKSFPFDEVDVTGVVIRIQSQPKPQRQPCADYESGARVFIADLQRRFFALSFRIDSKNFDYGDSTDNGKIVAGLNLQWRKGWMCWKIPILYVSELSSFAQSTNIASAQQSIDQLRRHFQSNSLEAFVSECREKLNCIVDSVEHASTTNNARNVDVSVNQSVSACSLEALSTSVVTDTAHTSADSYPENERNRRTMFKNTSTRSKFEKLEGYGRPPALSPIVLTSQPKVRAKSKLPLLVSKKNFKS